MIKVNDVFKNYKIVIIFMMIFLIKGILYSLYVSPTVMYSSPDDVGHLSYIQYIATERKLPVVHETPLETISKSAFQAYNDKDYATYNEFYIDLEEFSDMTDKNWITQHPPLYYLLLTPIYLLARLYTNHLPTIIMILRIATIPIGLVSIFYIEKILRLLKASIIIRYCIHISFVFSPGIQYYYSMITNDSLLTLISIVSLYFLLKYLKYKKLYDFYLFVIFCALGILTKYTFGLVLIGYGFYFLFKSFKEDGIKYTTKLCVFGMILGVAILAPILGRNFILYGNIFEVANEQIKNYDFTIFEFIVDKNYLDELYTHIVMLIGWRTFIRAPIFMKSTATFILVFLALLCIIRDNYKYRRSLVALTSCFLIVILKQIFYLQVNLYLSIAAIFVIFLYMLLSNHISYEKREIIAFFIFTIFIVIIIYLKQHYTIGLNRGRTGAMHGRYYYIILFPFLYSIFSVIEEWSSKFKKYIPSALLTLLMLCEIQVIKICIEMW